MISVPDFNRIAPVYDSLSFMIFGKSILRAQIFFLAEIPADAKILVLGGGTGKFLKTLFNINPTCEIWYIDASPAMIERARKQVSDSSRCKFIVGTQDEIPKDIKFDRVVTFFYLDLFKDEELGKVLSTIKTSLHQDGRWIVSDFVKKDRLWARLLLKLMYSFFRLTCNISADRLPEWKTQMSLAGFSTVSQASFFSGFIESHVYEQLSE